ncbi:MAG TPA: alpha/beta fold hydrolase [Candidatus Acidoferrales bacterium]|nr:alpha/beta fold hydrolase [Candidatus Acidoferrales bacterium]
MQTARRIAGILLLFLLAGETLTGEAAGSGILHPQRRALTPELVARAEEAFARAGAVREDFVVAAPDGARLRGWKVRAAHPNGDWVLLFHGVSDNRAGMTGQAEMLLRHGYSVAMMDARAHGESEGPMATYGWLERNDTRAIVDSLVATEALPASASIFASGESMGAAIALQSAGIEPRIRAVVAESAFRNLREVSYDYAGLYTSVLLGKTLLRPLAILAVRSGEREGGFRAEDVSPERAVAARAFPVLLICGLDDHNIPPRHTRAIYAAATGPKEMWLVPGAGHTQAQGRAPEEFERRVTSFFARAHASEAPRESSPPQSR